MPEQNHSVRRCLIVERHGWETGTNQRQLQFLLATAKDFFGSGKQDRNIKIRVFLPADASTPTFEQNIVISREYPNGTRRTNRFPLMGGIPASFIFFEETSNPGIYDFWWQLDMPVIAAKYEGWSQGRNTQYGRGRLSVIVSAPVPRIIKSL